jgi:hypothetical protein
LALCTSSSPHSTFYHRQTQHHPILFRYFDWHTRVQIRHLSFGGGQNEDDDDDDAESNNNIVYQSSFAFSIMCMFFTILYASFSALIFHNSYKLIEESVAEARDELLVNAEGHHISEMNSAPGYIGGDRFGVARSYGKSVGSGGTKPIEVL